MHAVMAVALVAVSAAFVVTGVFTADAVIGRLRWRGRAQRAEEAVAKSKQTAAERIQEAQADAKVARQTAELAQADARSADQRSMELAAELADLRAAHAVELKRLEAAAADARKDAELLRQEAVQKARTYGEALAVANRGRAEAVNELRALRMAIAAAQKHLGTADERAETAEAYLGN